MKVKTHTIMRQCLENGIRAGLHKADKRGQLHLVEGREEDATDEVLNYALVALDEHFTWDDEE